MIILQTLMQLTRMLEVSEIWKSQTTKMIIENDSKVNVRKKLLEKPTDIEYTLYNKRPDMLIQPKKRNTSSI